MEIDSGKPTYCFANESKVLVEIKPNGDVFRGEKKIGNLTEILDAAVIMIKCIVCPGLLVEGKSK